MTYAIASNQEQAVTTFQSFSVDDRLALMWHMYNHFGGAISQRNDRDTGGYDALAPLIPEIREMRPGEQLDVMRSLVEGKDTAISRSYGKFGSSEQMAFWYRLAHGIDDQSIIQVPSEYELPADAQAFLTEFKAIEFELKVVLFRNIVSKMGIPTRT